MIRIRYTLKLRAALAVAVEEDGTRKVNRGRADDQAEDERTKAR